MGRVMDNTTQGYVRTGEDRSRKTRATSFKPMSRSTGEQALKVRAEGRDARDDDEGDQGCR